MAHRSYGQFCPIAAGLDAVGDRWALLIVRDLFLGPRRFGELADGLPGISTDILTSRLRALEKEGVIRRNGARRAYQLTEPGRALVPVLRAVARWGALRLTPPDTLDEVQPRLVLTLLLLPGRAPADFAGMFEIRTGDDVVRIAARDTNLAVLADESPGEPDATIELTRAGLVTVMLGGGTRDLSSPGDLVISGDRRAARRLLDGLATSSFVR